MRAKQYKVVLTQEARNELLAITKKGNHPARQITRARILLFWDRKPEGGKGTVLTDAEIAGRCRCGRELVYTVSKQYAQEGLERALTRKKRETPPVPPKVTGEVEAKIIAMACGQPPDGYSRWSLRLYEEHSKKVAGIQLSDTTIRQVLKKLPSSRI